MRSQCRLLHSADVLFRRINQRPLANHLIGFEAIIRSRFMFNKIYITYHLYCRFLRIYCESPESNPIQICAKVLPFPTEPGPIMSCSSWYKAETWKWISYCYIARLCKVTSYVHPTWVLIHLSSTYLSCCLNIYTLHLFLLIKKQLSEDAAFYCAR